MNELQKLVYKNDKGIFCDSRMIAEKFEKRHADVIRDINNLLESLNKVSERNLAFTSNELIFNEISYIDKSNRNSKCYEMNQQAFSLLVMKFTGFKALQWQIKFNDAFYRMEKKLKEQLPQTKLEWMKLAVEIEEKNELLQIENKKQDFMIKKIEPKAELYNRTMDSSTTFSAKEVAKILDLKKGGNTLFKELRKMKILMDGKNKSQHNTPYQKYKNRNYFKVIEISRGNIGIIDLQTRFYAKGIDFIAKKLPKNMFNKCKENDTSLNINELLEI